MGNIINFHQYKDEIMKSLENKKNMGINEPVTLIDGFVNQAITESLDGNFVVGGPSIPMVMLLGGNSGRIYYFALKALLPNINL